MWIYRLYIRVYFYKSLCHFADNFTLNWTILEILSIEVLWSITHSVSGIAYYWQFHFGLIWKSKHLSVFSGGQSGLLLITQTNIVWVFGNILSVKLRPQWVNIKEWVFSMIYLGSWHSVQALESLITNSWEVHICTFIGNFNSLESIILK